MKSINCSEFTDLATCAVRYALGRSTYVSESIPRAILNNIDYVTTKGLKVIIRDIEEYKQRYGHIGMDCDERSWNHFKDMIEDMIEIRQYHEQKDKT